MLNSFSMAFRQGLHEFLFRASEPLRHLRLETLEALALLSLSLALIITWFLRISWRFSKPAVRDQTIRGTAHNFTSSLKFNAQAYLSWRGIGGGIMGPLAKQAISEDSRRYIVATIVDSARKRPVLYKEMLVRPGLGPGALGVDEVQLDQSDLTHVRFNNLYEDDDTAEAPISGKYDIYLRPIQWWDIRHWLAHPNREIRIVIWVTIITTAIPYVLQGLGMLGEAAASLVSQH